MEHNLEVEKIGIKLGRKKEFAARIYRTGHIYAHDCVTLRSCPGDDFLEEHLQKAADVKLDDYYVKMMVARYLATGLAKNYDSFVKAIEERKFDTVIHNKAIQKAVGSYRVSDEHKEYLKTLKVK